MKKNVRILCYVLLCALILPKSYVFAFSEQRKFIGQEYDAGTELNYLNARYYDAKRGQFISQDPMFWNPTPELLADPQQLNSYSYARNNPITASDPSGLLTVVIPGTGYSEKDWSSSGSMSNFISSVSKTFNETHKTEIINSKNVWSGGDNKGARQKAADYITSTIKDHKFADGEQLNIVGHSHGGNIGILVSQMTDHKIDNLVTLGTPVRSDYKPNSEMIGKHTNVYSNLDPVQLFLGGKGGYTHPFGATGIANKLINYFVEFGPAGRKYNGAENVHVTREAWNPFTAHDQLLSNSVWSKVDKMINK